MFAVGTAYFMHARRVNMGLSEVLAFFRLPLLSSAVKFCLRFVWTAKT